MKHRHMLATVNKVLCSLITHSTKIFKMLSKNRRAVNGLFYFGIPKITTGLLRHIYL